MEVDDKMKMDEDLVARLEADTAYFKSMIRLIPAKYYMDDKDDLAVQSSKFFHNKAQKAPKQVIKEASRKAKRQRLGPESLKTADQLQEERAAERNAAAAKDALSSIGATPGISRSLDREQRLEQSQKCSSSSIDSVTTTRPGIVDEEGRVVFSKFDFSVSQQQKSARKKDYKKLLAKAESRQKHLEMLQRQDEASAADKVERHSWERAMKKSEGQKLVDDPKLLKKTIKRKEEKKKQSKKKWGERVAAQKKRQDERQEKRQKNLRERIQQRKTKGSKGKGKGNPTGKRNGKKSKGRKPGF